MKSTIFSLLILLFFSTPALAAPDLDILLESVVKVSFKGHSATGFLISHDGYILTCGHVFNDYETDEDVSRISVRLFSPEQIAYNVPLVGLKKSKEKGGALNTVELREVYSEYALLKVPASQVYNREPLRFAQPPERGDPIYFCAVGANSAPRLTKRLVVAANPTFFLFSPTVLPGDSGSPVLDPNGRVIGIVLIQHTMSWGGATQLPHVKSLLPPAYSSILDDPPAHSTSNPAAHN